LCVIVASGPLAAYYWTGAAVLGLVAKILVTESAPIKQRRASVGR